MKIVSKKQRLSQVVKLNRKQKWMIYLNSIDNVDVSKTAFQLIFMC